MHTKKGWSSCGRTIQPRAEVWLPLGDGRPNMYHLRVKGARVKDGPVEVLGVEEVMEETHPDPTT